VALPDETVRDRAVFVFLHTTEPIKAPPAAFPEASVAIKLPKRPCCLLIVIFPSLTATNDKVLDEFFTTWYVSFSIASEVASTCCIQITITFAPSYFKESKPCLSLAFVSVYPNALISCSSSSLNVNPYLLYVNPLTIGVAVGVEVGMGVGVAVGVEVGMGVGVAVGVEVGMGVAVGAGVGEGGISVGVGTGVEVGLGGVVGCISTGFVGRGSVTFPEPPQDIIASETTAKTESFTKFIL
jgi:hypothetical protein